MSWWAVDVRTAPEDRARVSAWLVRESGHAVEERPDGLLVGFALNEADARSLGARLGDLYPADVRVWLRPVEAGEMLGDSILILDGLQAGEQVAASGAFKLREGVLVVVQTGQATQAQGNGGQ